MGAAPVVVEPHHAMPGVYVLRGKDDSLCTLNLVPGVSVYQEKRVAVKDPSAVGDDGQPVSKEYRVWNPFRSKIAAAIAGKIAGIHIVPGSRVLYLGAASGTTVSHVSDIVGPTGVVYAVEFSLRSGRDLVEMAKRRPNIVPIIEDARYPQRYRMLVGMCDVVFIDVAQPNETEILVANAAHYLKDDGHFLISIKANCIDSTAAPEKVFQSEIEKMRTLGLKPKVYVTLEPFQRDHAVVAGVYRPTAKAGAAAAAAAPAAEERPAKRPRPAK